MSRTEQIPVSVMGRTFSIGTPESEKDILMQAVALLNQKTEAVKSGGRERSFGNAPEAVRDGRLV